MNTPLKDMGPEKPFMGCIYKLECGKENIPIISCCVLNRHFKTIESMIDAITGADNGLERIFNQSSIFLCCVNSLELILVQNRTIVATFPQL